VEAKEVRNHGDHDETLNDEIADDSSDEEYESQK